MIATTMRMIHDDIATAQANLSGDHPAQEHLENAAAALDAPYLGISNALSQAFGHLGSAAIALIDNPDHDEPHLTIQSALLIAGAKARVDILR